MREPSATSRYTPVISVGRSVPESVIDAFERDHQAGVTSAEALAFFQERGVRLSEATFRRYVQLGLLPRSRRVGRKGRNRGSEGIYPVSVVRRLNEVKGLLERALSIEEIRAAFRVREDDVEEIRQRLGTVIEAAAERLRGAPDVELERQLARLRELAGQVEEALRAVVRELAHRHERKCRAV